MHPNSRLDELLPHEWKRLRAADSSPGAGYLSQPPSEMQKQHAFNAPAPAVALHPESYFQKDSIRGLTDQERFEQLCELVIAANNSPLIIIAMNPGKSVLCSGDSALSVYFDGRNHGFNGATIGADIFHEGLFVRRA